MRADRIVLCIDWSSYAANPEVVPYVTGAIWSRRGLVTTLGVNRPSHAIPLSIGHTEVTMHRSAPRHYCITLDRNELNIKPLEENLVLRNDHHRERQSIYSMAQLFGAELLGLRVPAPTTSPTQPERGHSAIIWRDNPV